MQFSIALTGLLSLAGSAVAQSLQATVAENAKVNVRTDGFKCPSDMKYSPWAKSCACAPGQTFDVKAAKCTGEIIKGCWPEPDLSLYASVNVGVELATFCAASPTKICRYDAKHEYCQAGLNTVAFVAAVDIAAEVELLGLAEIDVQANISADLKATVAGLTGLYVEKVEDAVKLFNTDHFDLNVNVLDIIDINAELGGVVSLVRHLTCGLGLSKCNFDCVSYCTKGCANYIDVEVDVEIGTGIDHLIGFCILPSVILIVNSLKHVITVTVESLLCLVGNILTHVLSIFDCHCA